jgi:nucleoside-diphosphate-sugar epimerase
MQAGHPADGATGSTAAHHSLSIARELSGRSVLLTGATGYVGRLVLEQLLRCCPDIAAVYVLVRPGQQQRRLQAAAVPTSSKTSSKSSEPQQHSTATSSDGVTEAAAASSGTTPAPAAGSGSRRGNSSSSSTCAAAARGRLLHLVTSSGLFNTAPSAQLAKVHVVEGDLSKAGLGLAAGQVAELARHVDVVIHAAGHVDLGACEMMEQAWMPAPPAC